MTQQTDVVPQKHTVDSLSQAIFIVNRHAKTAPNPKYLYSLKHKALKKLISENKAKKVGLHFSKNPKFSQQQSDVLVKCGRYSFHIPPTKEDFKNLPHLGELDRHTRNPRTNLPLNKAKRMLEQYVGTKPKRNYRKRQRRQQSRNKPIFKPLGESYF